MAGERSVRKRRGNKRLTTLDADEHDDGAVAMQRSPGNDSPCVNSER
jgi:hypothetical protein